MSNVKLFLSIALLSVLAACGGSGGGGSVTPGLPADALAITTDNTTAVAQSAVSTIESISTIADSLGVEASVPPVRTAIDTLIDHAFNHENRSVSVATGVTESGACPNGGTFSDTYSFTNTSASGRISYSNCDFGGVEFNGGFSYSSTWNNDTGAYSDNGNGSLTTTIGSDSFTMTVDYSETGNDISGDYSVELSYSITGSNIGGFLVETTQPLTGVNFNDVTSGQVIVTGANSTRLRITITSSTTADVDFDNGNGTFVFHSQIFI